MIDAIKSYLGITWDDEDIKIQSIIDRGKSRLEGLTGAKLDFTSEGLARELLFDYCRYAYNNASEYFEKNYQSEIMRLQVKSGIQLLGCLSSLEIEGITLNPTFEPQTYEYTASTTDIENKIIAEVINQDATIDIKVNGDSHENNTVYTWQEGTNEIIITVDNNDHSQTYTVTVTKS